MSTYWGYHCKECPQSRSDVDDEGIGAFSPTWDNHGDDRLRALALAAPELIALTTKIKGTGAEGWLEIGWLGGYDYPLPPEWLTLHAGHDIELRNEYGKVESLRAASPADVREVGEGEA